MANGLVDVYDCDSALGGDDNEFFCTVDLMFASPAPLAGSKRSAEHATLDHVQPTIAGLASRQEYRTGHIDPKALSFRPCDDAACAGPASHSRPAKRRASVKPSGHSLGPREQADLHCRGSEQSACLQGAPCNSTLHTGRQSPDFSSIDDFCRLDCDTTCSPPSCVLPCSDERQCSPEDACWDPVCEQLLCADECNDPECTKTLDTDDPCFCQKCGAQPCFLGDPASNCHVAHSGPTTSGTIVCYDNAPCHFQDGSHGFDPGLSGYETYPCYTKSHELFGPGYSATDAPSLALSAPSISDYPSLETAFSTQSSPTHPSTTAQCYLNILSEHCHIDNSCCHGPSRACGEDPTAPREYLDLWNASVSEGNVLANGLMKFGLHPGHSTANRPLGPIEDTTAFGNLQHPMFNFDDSSWILPHSHYFNGPPTPVTGASKLDLLASAVQNDVLKPALKAPNMTFSPVRIPIKAEPVLGMEASLMEACVCKWKHGAGLLCLAVFDSAEALHKHVKTAHVDSCTSCFCQWEGCEAATKDFKQRSKLSRHLLGHAGHRPYACSFEACDKSFATNQAKDNHERTHTGDKPYKCDSCDYETTTYTQLQTHVSALHDGKKPHKCRYCEFSCADSSNLSKHERTHQTLRPYRCPHANCTFKPDCRWENLKRHLRRSGHCPQLLVDGSEENKAYRENVKRETEDWQKRSDHDGAGKMARRKGIS